MPPGGVAGALLALGMGAAAGGCMHEPGRARTNEALPAETYTSEAYVRSRWLPKLEDGVTKRAEILAALGEPTASFQGQGIVAYRLLLVERADPLLSGGYRELMFQFSLWRGMTSRVGSDARREVLAREGVLVAARPSAGEELLLRELSREAEYSLVMVFDGDGVMRRHRLLRIVP